MEGMGVDGVEGVDGMGVDGGKGVTREGGQ